MTLRPSAPLRTPLSALLPSLAAAVRGDVEGVVLTGTTLDSRRVVPGDLYLALPGAAAHGASYAAEAVGAGAVAILTDPSGADLIETDLVKAAAGVPIVVIDNPRFSVGKIAARLYGDPARELTLLAVTGTQGKTTTTRLADGALHAAGIGSAVIGTVGTRINGTEVKTSLTTPEAPDLHALFALMVERGVRACAMEVSSHALVMGRVDGVCFDVAVFTNLGRDHLDFHTDLEDYYAAKASLFTPERCTVAVVNIDDEHGARLARECTVPVRTFSTRGGADWQAVEIEAYAAESAFTVLRDGAEVGRARVGLAGEFNVANALAAIAGLAEAGLDAVRITQAIGAAGGVPGRLERVDAGQPFLAIVDYAHKPDAVTAVLEALRPATTGRVILVIGAGGDRDRGKRPLMGAIASELADIVIVTDDNPRSEDPAAIRAEVLAGATGPAEQHEVGDRAEAIKLAVSLARANDTVVVAGKGHETGQEAHGVITPFDDREVLRAALEQEV
ncbi:MAG: UDP-N-acetylmuramoyl-L-alanyl-D-glutamate--2,6-diaminopimelate ligase [Nocardioidaceae bacterium]